MNPGSRMRLGIFFCVVLVLSALTACLLAMTRYGLWLPR
jgi:hypothetical protein